MKLGFTVLALMAAAPVLAEAQGGTEQPREAKRVTVEDLKTILTRGTTEQLDNLLNHGIAADTRVGKEAMPLLVMAAYTGRVEMVHTILKHGADPNASQKPGISALSVAAATNNAHMLDLLLAHGADKNFRALQGDSVLMLACSQNALDTIQLLLASKADPNLADANGVTPLIYSIARCQEPHVVSLMLLEHGADPNARMKDGTTALIAAAMRNNVECTRQLLRYGADVSARDAEGHSAREVAKNPEIQKLLDAATP
ncbi:MAG: ankyrin repeat domain-containing protein [Akkermansia sp.]|nr:ankyrin repeat domain-containing protein [Akkermansia sp.]